MYQGVFWLRASSNTINSTNKMITLGNDVQSLYDCSEIIYDCFYDDQYGDDGKYRPDKAI